MIGKLLAACLLVAISARPASAAMADRVFLDKNSCRTAPSELLQSLYIGLQEFQPYVDLCPVPGKNGKPILYVLTPRIDIGGGDFPFMEKFNKKGHGLPRELFILNLNMNFVGKFPDCFPSDPPDELDVIFSNWKGGFPYRIDFYFHANSMSGPRYRKPLYWNPGTAKFQEDPP
jgi:hypothetical protein